MRSHLAALSFVVASCARLALAQTPPETPATRPLEAQTPAVAPAPAPGEARPANVTAGLGRGVVLRTDDGRFSLNIRGRIQARFTAVETDNPGRRYELIDEPSTEFQIRRMRMVFAGDVFGPSLQYYIQLAFSNLDTEPDLRLPLRDAYVTWSPLRDLAVRFGQMKVPYGRQRVVSSSALQFADRSLAVGEFNLDRDVGVVLFSKDLFGLGHRLRYELGLFGGDGRNRLSDDFGLLYVGRVQVQPFGEYDDLSEADTLRLSRPRMAIGLAAAFNHNSRRARSTFGDTYQRGFDFFQLAADMQLKWAGFSFQAEWLYRRADGDAHTLTTTNAMGQPLREVARVGHGYYLQAGYLFTQHLEAAVRWGEILPFSDATVPLHHTREIGAALSWYVQRHDLKLQADYFYLTGEDLSVGRSQFRLQAQLYF